MRVQILLSSIVLCSAFGCGDDGIGRPDMGAADASTTPADADAPDAGADAGTPITDAGEIEDASSPTDAGPEDSGFADASEPDAGLVDTGLADAGPSDTGASDGSVPDGGNCPATAGFCWLHPAGLGASLYSVSGASDDDVWAVGLDGVIVHFGLTSVEPWASPTTSSLYDVHARTASDVWAVGDAGAVVHFDGNAWSSVSGVSGDDLRAVFALDANIVWMAGDRRVYRYDGQNIVESPHPFQYDLGGSAIFAFADDDVWIGTVFGTGLHYDGTAWTYSDSLYHNDTITDFWGASASDVWAVSDYGADVSRFDGTTWTRVPYSAGVTPENVATVHGRAANDVWLAGQLGLWHYDGQSFTRYDAPVAQYASIAPQGAWVGANRTLVVGLAGHVFDWRSAAWSLASGPERGIYMRWFDIEAVAPNDVWFFGLGTSMHYDGLSFTEVPTAMTTYRQDFVGSWSSGPQDIWIAGIGSWGDNLQRFDGTSFSRVPDGGFNGPDWILGVWGSSSSDIYFAAEGSSFHWDGSSFQTLGVSASFEAIHGTGASDVWAVSGTGGSTSVPPAASNGIWHFDGQNWTQPVHDNVWWSAVHAIAPNDVWAGGGGGTIKHWDGSMWTTMPIPGLTTADPQNAPFVGSFAARASNDVYAVTGSRLLHWDGSTWTILPSFGAGLSAAAVTSDGAVYVTGGSDAVLRRR